MDSALRKKGFHAEEGRRHTKYHLRVDGAETGVVTFLDRHAGEYGDFLLAKVAKQLGLSRGELFDLVSCPLVYEKYVSILREKGLL